MKIKIKYHNQNCKIEQHGNWIDLKSAETIELNYPKQIEKYPVGFDLMKSSYNSIEENRFYITEFDSKLVPLGVSMKLPKYFEANIVPRSSLFLKKGLIQGNHYAVIDDAYSGTFDIWKYSVIALNDTIISEGERICQFSTRISMNAPWYVKLRWLFNSKIKFVEVDNLDDKDRGGFGNSGGYKN